MTDRSLSACRILVVEDEYLLAAELAQELANAGADVLGPVPTIEQALAVLSDTMPHGAILDVNLSGVPVFPLADTLIKRGVSLVFTTGYDADTLPDRFADVPICGKPINIALVKATIAQAIHA